MRLSCIYSNHNCRIRWNACHGKKILSMGIKNIWIVKINLEISIEVQGKSTTVHNKTKNTISNTKFCDLVWPFKLRKNIGRDGVIKSIKWLEEINIQVLPEPRVGLVLVETQV